MSKQEVPSVVAQCIIVKFLMKENAKTIEIERFKNSSQMTIFQESRHLNGVTYEYTDKERDALQLKYTHRQQTSLNNNNANRVNDSFFFICIMIYLLIFTKIMMKFLKT